ncbi:MAG: hypothetical protein QM771_15290 [Nitrospira sp.]
MAQRDDWLTRAMFKTIALLQSDFSKLYTRFVQLDRKSDRLFLQSERAINRSLQLLMQLNNSEPKR